MFFHFLTRAERPDFYERGAPAGDGPDFRDTPSFQVDEGDDQLVRRAEPGQEFLDQFPGGEAVRRQQFGRGGDEGLQNLLLLRGEVGPAQFRAGAFAVNLVEAGVDGDAGDPMLQRHVPGILFEFGEHFRKNHLHHVFLVRAARTAGPDEFEHERVEVLEQQARRVFVALNDLANASRDIQPIFRHKEFAADILTDDDSADGAGLQGIVINRPKTRSITGASADASKPGCNRNRGFLSLKEVK